MKIFNNFWWTLGLMLLVAIADLIALPTKIEFGAGFVLAMLYFIAWIVYKVKNSTK